MGSSGSILHLRTAACKHELARAYLEGGLWDKAEPLLREVVNVDREQGAAKEVGTADALNSIPRFDLRGEGRCTATMRTLQSYVRRQLNC